MTSASTCSELSLALRDFLAWCAAHPDAPLEDLWHAYDTQLRSVWQPFSAAWLALRIAPAHRVPLAQICAQIATARLGYLPFPARGDNALEAKLWEVAFALNRHTKTPRDWEIINGYLAPVHRLADLYRRASRSDADAVALLIENVALPLNANEGVGAHYQASQLIFQGAHITTDEPPKIADVRARLGLCYRLKLRGFAAHWVQTSIEIGEQRLRAAPQVLAARIKTDDRAG